MRNIYLVRHGKIRQEAGGRRCIGQTDLPLDEKYVSSILKLGNWFAERQHHQKASVVLASGTLKRACDTAKYLKEGAGEIIFGNILFDENLNEVYTGLWEASLKRLRSRIRSGSKKGENRLDDSRVKENEIVSVEERYQASYGKCHCAEAYKKHEVLYEKAKSIEKKIFG